jgi:predicted membrane channel-forming protein YqfA (hemolysin III family)
MVPITKGKLTFFKRFRPFWAFLLCGTFFTLTSVNNHHSSLKSIVMYIGIGTLVLVVILFLIFRRA